MVQFRYLRVYFGIDFFPSSVAMNRRIENGLKLRPKTRTQQDTGHKATG